MIFLTVPGSSHAGDAINSCRAETGSRRCKNQLFPSLVARGKELFVTRYGKNAPLAAVVAGTETD